MTNLELAIKTIIKECKLKTENDEIFCKKVSQKMLQSFAGYTTNFETIFQNKISISHGCQVPIEFCDIPFFSHCVHHFSPIIGHINFSYTPQNHIIGFSKVIEVITSVTKKLHLQETLGQEIADVFIRHLSPKEIEIEITAQHYCMQVSANDNLPKIKTTFNYKKVAFL